MNSSIGIIGLGFVGGSILKSFQIKGINVEGYDKYKNGGIGKFENMYQKEFLFLCLPTLYNNELKKYDLSSIEETCKLLENKYSGIVIIKSTVEPETTYMLSEKYHLKIIHNPEFLSAATAFEDFHNQTHIVLGTGPNISNTELQTLKNFYLSHYPEAEISLVTSNESESMKIFVNSFYATKIQFFNELYLVCQENSCDYNVIKNLMLKNKWINPMHTQVPGSDGSLSYGGACFPKDTQALLEYMKRKKSRHQVLQAVVDEREEMRN